MTARIDVRNPRTGVVDHRIDAPSSDELAETAARLRRAQRPWLDEGLEARTKALDEWHRAIAARRPQIVDALVADTGRRTESEMEVDAVLGSLQRWCRTAADLLTPQPPRPAAIPWIEVQQDTSPYPLVGVISPWNFPFLLSVIDAIPALVAGCAVVVKPSEIAPRFIEAVTSSIDDVPILAEVFSYVAGDGRTGEALIDLVDLVCFTGSVATGRKVAEQAAHRFIPAFLELGGKDPAIVLASADIDRATSAVLWGSTANAGQSCQSIERVYVDRAVADVFVDLLVAKAEAVTLARPTPESGQLGPIIAARQAETIADHLADARARGATVRSGGEVEHLDGGAWCRPTVLTGVDHSMKVMTEETFGPVIPVMSVDGAPEAVRLANDTIYGLSAAVFAGTPEEALEVARDLNAGAVSINDAALTALVHDAEKQSFNLSGLGGSRMGPGAIRRFGRRRAFLVSDPPGPDPWWYPHLRDEGR